MKIKKLACILMAMLVIFTATACDSNTTSNVSSGSVTSTQTQTSSLQSSVEPEEPLPELISRTPKKLGQMKMLETFYAPAAAETVYVVDAKGLTQQELLPLKCLQGLVAREESAAIYINYNSDDEFWSMLAQSEVPAFYKNVTPEWIFENYASLVENIYVYDTTEGAEYQMYMALNLASQNNGIAINRDIYKKHSKIAEKKITTVDIAKQYPHKEDAYKYMTDIALKSGTKNYVAILQDDYDFVDYLYATQTPILWNELVQAQSSSIVTTITNEQYQTPAILFTAGEADNAFLEKLYSIGFGSLNVTNCSNITYFASTTSHNFGHTEPQDKKAEDKNIYISVVLDTTFPGAFTSGKDIINSPFWGKYPMGIEVDTALIELAPEILHWYNLNLGKNNEFVVSADSICHVNQNTMPDDALKQWQTVNNYYNKILGAGTVATPFIPNQTFVDDYKYTELTDAKGFYTTAALPAGTLPTIENGQIIVPLTVVEDTVELDLFFQSLKPIDDKPQFYAIEYKVETLKEYNELAGLMQESAKKDYINFVLPKDLNLTAMNYYDSVMESKMPDTLFPSQSGSQSTSQSVNLNGTE